MDPRIAGAPPLAEFSVGQRVMTREGFPGVINDIVEGPGSLGSYFVTLDNDQGGGEYGEGEVWPLGEPSTASRIDASVEHTAADDYPELGTILSDRLPPKITAKEAGYVDTPESEALFLQAADLIGQGNDAMAWVDEVKTATSDEARDWGLSEAHEDMEGEGFVEPPYPEDAAQVAAKLALYLPPKPPDEQRSSTTPLTGKQKTGYDEGFSQGQEGITRSPSDPLDEDFMIGFEIGWAEGVMVYREPVRSWDIEDLGKDQTADVPPATLPATAPYMLSSLASEDDWGLSAEGGSIIDLIRGHPRPGPGWGGIGREYSYDWCRFRRESHCWLPKELNEVASKQAGYAVWIPEDRGHCNRLTWESQQRCPTGAPGPHSGEGGFTDATVSWEAGGQRNGVPDNFRSASKTSAIWREWDGEQEEGTVSSPRHKTGLAYVIQNADPGDPGPFVWALLSGTRMTQIAVGYADSLEQAREDAEAAATRGGKEALQTHAAFEMTATWKDIQAKAKRIRSEGGVRMVSVVDNVVVAHVKGDNGVYETELVRYPGKKNAAAWHCGCKWSSYSWGRSGPWKRYEGRMCSHALAVQYEAQSRGAHGREMTLDEKQPSWMDAKHVHRPGDFDKNKQRYSAKADFQVEFQHAHQDKPTKMSYASPDTAIRWARQAFEAGAVLARVTRKSDGKVIYDGPGGISLEVDDWYTASLHPVEDLSEDDLAPIAVMAHSMLSEGVPYREVRSMLLSHGIERPAEITRLARSTTFRARVKGLIRDLFLDDDGVKEETGQAVEPYEVIYPGWHPTKGLNPNDTGRVWASKTAKDQNVSPSEHGDSRLQDAGVSVKKTKDGKYYVCTHRARGKYRDSVADIPDSEIEYIRSTGSLDNDDWGLSTVAAPEWRINGKPYSDGVWIEVEPDIWYRGAARGEIPSRAVVKREGEKWLWEMQVLTFIGAPHEYTGWQKGGKTPSGSAKTLEQAQAKALASIAKDQEFFQRYDERQRANLEETFNRAAMRVTADEDQCPFDASDSLMHGGFYVCEDGHTWHPDEPAAKAYHEGPGVIQPLESSQFGQFAEIPALMMGWNAEEPSYNHEPQTFWPAHGKQAAYYTEDDMRAAWLASPEAQSGMTAEEAMAKLVAEQEAHFAEAAVVATKEYVQVGNEEHAREVTETKGQVSVNGQPYGTLRRDTQRTTRREWVLTDLNGKETEHPAKGDALYHAGRNHKTSAKKDDAPTVSGVALKAADTGRILMLQRGLEDEKDPARGKWEFPGGHHEDGDLTSLHAGVREWEEEVGVSFPTEGVVAHTWTSDNGVYQGHVVVIPKERDLILTEGRDVDNPDDPDGDVSEQVAWWDPDDARKNPAIREECKATPWSNLKSAHKEGTKMDIADEFGSLFDQAASDLNTTASQQQQVLSHWGISATFHEEPEPALPSTDGAEEEEAARTAARLRAALHGVPAPAPAPTPVAPSAPTPNQTPVSVGTSHQAANVTCPKCNSTFGPGEDIEVVAGVGLQHKGPCPSQQQSQSSLSARPGETEEERGRRLLAYVDASLSGQEVAGPNPYAHLMAGQADNEVASAAANYLVTKGASGGGIQGHAGGQVQVEALKTYSAPERQEIINEGEGGEQASNLDRLDIKGTHYEALEATSSRDLIRQVAGGRDVPEDEDMMFLDGDPNLPDPV